MSEPFGEIACDCPRCQDIPAFLLPRHRIEKVVGGVVVYEDGYFISSFSTVEEAKEWIKERLNERTQNRSANVSGRVCLRHLQCRRDDSFRHKIPVGTAARISAQVQLLRLSAVLRSCLPVDGHRAISGVNMLLCDYQIFWHQHRQRPEWAMKWNFRRYNSTDASNAT